MAIVIDSKKVKQSGQLFQSSFHLLNANSYKHLISPYDVIPESHIKVLRVKEMITN